MTALPEALAPVGAAAPPPPPVDPAGDALFLDVDGTLAEIADTPDAARLSPRMLALIAAAHARLGGRLALLSGRSIGQLDHLVPLPGLALAGVHGLERRLPGGRVERPWPSAALDAARAGIHRLAAAEPGLLVEEKGLSVGLHYRASPHLGPQVHARLQALAETHGLAVQTGKMVVELRLPGADKGAALRRFMAVAPFAGHRPVFAGDDDTDEAAFAAAAALGGHGIRIGAPAPRTAARFALPDVAAVAAWLAGLA